MKNPSSIRNSWLSNVFQMRSHYSFRASIPLWVIFTFVGLGQGAQAALLWNFDSSDGNGNRIFGQLTTGVVGFIPESPEPTIVTVQGFNSVFSVSSDSPTTTNDITGMVIAGSFLPTDSERNDIFLEFLSVDFKSLENSQLFGNHMQQSGGESTLTLADPDSGKTTSLSIAGQPSFNLDFSPTSTTITFVPVPVPEISNYGLVSGGALFLFAHWRRRIQSSPQTHLLNCVNATNTR